MLSKISWSEFIWFLVFVLATYYAAVLSLYFRKEVFALLQHGSPKILSVVSLNDEISLSVVHDLLEDLKKVFSIAAKTKMVKEELLQAIRVKLKSYPGLQGSDLQEDISNHIKIEAKTICGITLETTELKQFWNP